MITWHGYDGVRTPLDRKPLALPGRLFLLMLAISAPLYYHVSATRNETSALLSPPAGSEAVLRVALAEVVR